MMTCGRRHFVTTASYGFAALALGRLWRSIASPVQLRVLLMPSLGAAERGEMCVLGVTMGADEAHHSAALFSGSVHLTVTEPVRDGDAASARRWLAKTSPSVLLGGESVDACRVLAETAAEARVLYVNVLCGADILRGAACERHAFHVAPSDAMIHSALSQWSARKQAANDAAEIVAWHSSLERFGADTLNQRFRDRFQREMTADAWAGWLSVKALAEAALRSATTSASALIQYFESDAAQWDGHKGRPLSFRSWDHQLRPCVGP